MRPSDTTAQLVRQYVGDLDELRARVDVACSYGGSPIVATPGGEHKTSSLPPGAPPLPKPDPMVTTVLRRRGRPRSHTAAVTEINPDHQMVYPEEGKESG